MNKIMSMTALAVLLASCASSPPGTPPPPCPVEGFISAEGHIWGDGERAYHLGHDALSPVLVNESTYEVDVESWNDLGTPLELRTEGEGFSLTVIEGGDLQSGWLGLASIEVDAEGHIQSGQVTMNSTILADYTSNTADHVLCQEIGHLLGLEHNRNELDTCMNDCADAPSFRDCLNLDFGKTPNAHDGETLREVYAHVGDPPTPGDPPPPPCSAGVVILHTFEVFPEE